MRLLLDTHILLWAAQDSPRLSQSARHLIESPTSELFFSVVSLWEIVIKNSLRRADFSVDARGLRRGLLENGYAELPVTGEHTLALIPLPRLHNDPFDRLLIAQSMQEDLLLLSADEQVLRYQRYGAQVLESDGGLALHEPGPRYG